MLSVGPRIHAPLATRRAKEPWRPELMMHARDTPSLVNRVPRGAALHTWMFGRRNSAQRAVRMPSSNDMVLASPYRSRGSETNVHRKVWVGEALRETQPQARHVKNGLQSNCPAEGTGLQSIVPAMTGTHKQC